MSEKWPSLNAYETCGLSTLLKHASGLNSTFLLELSATEWEHSNATCRLFNPMPRFSKRARFSFATVLALMLLWLGVGQWQEMKKQSIILNDCFAKVQLQSNQVLLAPSHYVLSLQLDGPPSEDFSTPRLLSRGDRFSLGDEHVSMNYRVVNIGRTGVLIYYNCSSGPPAEVHHAVGLVKLPWK